MRERVLTTTRTLTAAQAIGTLLLAGAAAAFPREPAASVLRLPAVLLGLVAPAIGYRIYRKMQESAAKEPAIVRRLDRFRTATLVALGCTEGAALVGIVLFFVTRDPATLAGLAMHILLTGAVWPTEPRLDSFLEGAPPEAKEV